ncbi:MAG: amidase [Myxococcota bacterium]
MIFEEYDQFDALGLAEQVRRRRVSAGELLETAMARLEHVNGTLNAVIRPMVDQGRAAAARVDEGRGGGPFAGVPFLLKDLGLTVPGVPTSNGSRFAPGFVPSTESELVRRYREAGLVVFGKTNTPELGIQPVTEPERFGPTRNPWDLSRTAGGSSGGAGAAVAARVVPMAQGGDGGGSIRIPASCGGLFGLKPTRGRAPTGPDASELWSGLALEHVLTLSVRDSAAALDAIAGVEPWAPYHPPPTEGFLDALKTPVGRLRVAFHADPAMPSSVHPHCVAAVHDVAALLSELGHDVEEVSPGHAPFALAEAFLTIVAANASAEIDALAARAGVRPRPGDFEATTWLTRLIGRHASAADFVKAQHTLQAETRRLQRRYEAYDVVLTPTLGAPPVPLGALQASGPEAALQRALARLDQTAALRLPGLMKKAVERVYAFIPFTPVANFTGQPSMSVPLVWTEGLPIGTLLTGRFGDDALLLRLASQLEAARPWRDRRPPLIEK